jgi:hypothetical protein
MPETISASTNESTTPVAFQITELIKENQALKRRVEELEDKVSYYRLLQNWRAKDARPYY